MSLPIREYPGRLWVMSMGQPKAAFAFIRREREQLEVMALSRPLSSGLAVRAPIVFTNSSGKRIRQIAHQMGLFEIGSALPFGISAPETHVFRSIAT